MGGQCQPGVAEGLDHIGLFGDESRGDLATIGQPVGAGHPSRANRRKTARSNATCIGSGGQLDQHARAVTHGQRVALGVQVGATVELARSLLGVQRLAQRVDRLVEVGRGEVGAEGIDRAERKGMGFARSNEAAGTQIPIGLQVGGLAPVFLEGDPGVGEARTRR